MLSLDRWKDKVAIVTGASSGCGASIAEALVHHGIIVAGLARRKEKLQELGKKLQGKSGKFFPIQCDISKQDEIVSAFKQIKEKLGPVHILINNAGIGKPSTLIDGDPKNWKEVIDTNVLGLCIATQEAVKDMRANNVIGHIVHINSCLGHYVAHVPELNVYPASKFAVTALTETLRQEFNSIGSKIKITSVSPGPVDTEFASSSQQDQGEEFGQFFSKIVKLNGEDVANAVVYVLSTPPHVLVQELMIRPVGEPV